MPCVDTRLTRKHAAAYWTLAVALALPFAGCDCGTAPALRKCTTTADCPAGRTCVDNACTIPTTPDAGSDGASDGGPECLSSRDCAGGVCLAGACCAATSACGEACCDGTETCFANACVTPGPECTTSAECAAGAYCEPGLGTGSAVDGGVPSADAGTLLCLGALARGRCVSLPSHCGDPGADPATCIATCEYRPTVAALDAVEQWRWGPTALAHPNFTDVWSTPAVGRVYDTNCDGRVDSLDPPSIVFVSGNAQGSWCGDSGIDANGCRKGVLRVLDGKTGAELLALRRATTGSMGFMGFSLALGDVDDDGVMEIVAMTGEGYIAVIRGDGTIVGLSDLPLPNVNTTANMGWGGGLALADMDGNGNVEVAYGSTVWTISGGTVTRVFSGTGGTAGLLWQSLSIFGNADADPELELIAGRTVYDPTGTPLWDEPTLVDGFPAIANMDSDPAPEIVITGNGQVVIVDALTGAVELGPTAMPGTGSGGPPTIADFDGDGQPEIGAAMRDFYSVLKPNYAAGTIDVLWSTANHDLSSSVTGSTVFDFEGDGIAEVIYNDECFLWVYDGPTGAVRYAGLTLSFTATEASLVADVDGDGHAEIVMISNGASPSRWGCTNAPWTSADPATGRPAWVAPPGGVFRGITVFRDSANSWVGTRMLWNQHSYHVTNVCDDRDSACSPPLAYGAIPQREQSNWLVPWLNNYRQNVQDTALFNAPDATVTLLVECSTPLLLHAAVRNRGESLLPAGVTVGFFTRSGGTEVMLGMGVTTGALFPGQAEEVTLSAAGSAPTDTFFARILIDPMARTFRECDETNNQSADTMARCIF